VSNILLKVLGTLLIVVGIIAGVYLDIWVLFVGGILEFIQGVKATPTDTNAVVWGIVKTILLAGGGSALTLILLIFPGLSMVGIGVTRGSHRRPRNQRY
jgi:hypothetical protein